MIGIPELGDDKDVLSLNLPLFEDFLHRFPDLFFGSVTLGSVEEAKSCFQGGLGRNFCCDGVGNESSKSERGDVTGSVFEGYLRITKIVGGWHGFTPSMLSQLVSAGLVGNPFQKFIARCLRE